MRYSHSWASYPTEAAYARAWQDLLAGTWTILDHLTGASLGIAGPDGSGPPILDSHAGIAFNGDATTGQGP
jgi:hypothetical protein